MFHFRELTQSSGGLRSYILTGPFDLRSAADYCSVSETITCRSRGYHLSLRAMVVHNYGWLLEGASGFVKELTIFIDNRGYVVI